MMSISEFLDPVEGEVIDTPKYLEALVYFPISLQTPTNQETGTYCYSLWTSEQVKGRSCVGLR